MPEINEKISVCVIEFVSVFSNLQIFVQALFSPLQEIIFKDFILIITLYRMILTFFFSAQRCLERGHDKGPFQILQLSYRKLTSRCEMGARKDSNHCFCRCQEVQFCAKLQECSKLF